MKKNYIILIVFAFFQTTLFSQEIFFYTGINFTNYEFKSSTTNVNLQSNRGSHFTIGFRLPFKNERFKYDVALCLNQYNAAGDNSITAYYWDTDYFGGNFTALFYVLDGEKFNISINSGLTASTIVNSQQRVNGITRNLIQNDVFSGLWLQPKLGVQIKYLLKEKVHFSLGYNFSKSFNISNSTENKLSFVNNQIHIGVHYIWED